MTHLGQRWRGQDRRDSHGRSQPAKLLTGRPASAGCSSRVASVTTRIWRVRTTSANLPRYQLRSADHYLEGRWDSYEGAVFSEWNPHVHVCKPFAVPNEWPMWRGADDGFANPACVLWFAHDEMYNHVMLWRNFTNPGMTPEKMASVILAWMVAATWAA